jgi:hypothetical protein
MQIDLDALVLIIQQEVESRNLVFHADEIVGAEKDLEDVIVVAAEKFERKPHALEPQRRELITSGRLEIGQLVAFLDALPGKDDSDID